jgi:hypothetical protein
MKDGREQMPDLFDCSRQRVLLGLFSLHSIYPRKLLLTKYYSQQQQQAAAAAESHAFGLLDYRLIAPY